MIAFSVAYVAVIAVALHGACCCKSGLWRERRRDEWGKDSGGWGNRWFVGWGWWGKVAT